MYYYVGVYNMKEYLEEDGWKFNRITNDANGYVGNGGKVVAYAKITEDFQHILESLYDDGSALITNIVKEFNIAIIENVDRANNCVTVSFINSKSVWNHTDDELLVVVDNLFDYIYRFSQYGNGIPSDQNTQLPIYTSGARYKPDAMFGMIKDVALEYTIESCIYSIMLEDGAYKIVEEYIDYFRYILNNIMKCAMTTMAVHGTITVVDNNKGIGPTIDRANALGCAVMYSIIQIEQLLELKK